MPHYPKPFFKKARGLWYVEIDRKQINLGPDRDEAFLRYHQLMVRPREQRVPSDSLASLVDVFLDWVEKHRAPDTYEWYRYRLQRLVSAYPDLQAALLRPYHVEQWADQFELSAGSRRNYLRSIKTCFRWAVRQGYLDRNPIEALELPAGGKRDTFASPGEFSKLLEFVRSGCFRDLLITTYLTGCRPQESLRVAARHVDRSNARWIFPQDEAKGKQAPRIVYLTGESLQITLKLLQRYPEGPLFRNKLWRAWTPDAVNCEFGRIQVRMGQTALKASGETIDEAEISRFTKSLHKTKVVKGRELFKSEADLRCEAKRKLTVKRCRELAPRYSLYALRHSWATNALKRGVDPLTVAILMGHKDPSMLARVYQHLSHSPDHMLRQADRAAS